MRKDLIEIGLLHNNLPEVVKSIFAFHKMIKNIEDNPKAVKEAARKLKQKIEKIMEYVELGKMYEFQKVVQVTLDEYLPFFAYIQKLPQKMTTRQSTLLVVKYRKLLRLDVRNLDVIIKKIIDQEDTIDWGVEISKKPFSLPIFDSEEEMNEYKEREENPARYSKSLQDIVNEKYENVGGELILKSRLNPGIKINERRDYKI